MTATIHRVAFLSGSVPSVYRVGFGSGSVPVVYGVGFAASPASGGPRIYQAGFGTSGSKASVYRVGFQTVGTQAPPVVAPIPARTVDGWEQVVITPTSSPAADSWIYTVTAGSVTLTGSGTSRSFVAPAVFNGTTVKVAVQAVTGGVSSAPQTFTCTVKPWSSFVILGGAGTATIDGGTATTTPTDVYDGGTATSTPADLLTGGTSAVPAAAGTWVPRRPIQLIGGTPVHGFGIGPFGSTPFGS